MKNFLRISIVVVILVVMGVATYIAFFKPANKDEVYLELSKIADVEQELNNNLLDISDSNFSPATTKAGKETGFTAELVATYNNALKKDNNRKLLTNSDVLINVEVFYEIESGDNIEYEIAQYSYPKLKTYLDDVFNYYYAYSQAVNKTVPKKELNAMKDSIKNYKTAVEQVNGKLESIYNLQTYINENPTEDLSIELDGRYKAAVISFRGLINNYAKLIEDTRDFVTVYVFKGEMLTDKDSLLYDMMIKATISATDGDYSYTDYTIRKSADEDMDSATKFVSLAMSENKNEQLEKTYRFESGTVVYNSVAYNKTKYTHRAFDIELRIGEDDMLYYGDTNYKFLSSGQYIANHGTGVVSFTAQYSSNDQTVSSVVLDPMQFELKGSSYYKTIQFAYDGLNENRIYFNLGESSLVDSVSKRFVAITGYEGANVGVVEGKLQIPVIDASNSSLKSYLKLDFTNKEIDYYLINGNYYKLGESNKLVNIANNEYSLTDAVYYPSTFYSKSKLGMSSPEKLNYRQMVKSYNNVIKNSPEQLDMLISLTNEQKNLFVSGDSTVRVNFLEAYYSDLEYILACYGFIGEVA